MSNTRKASIQKRRRLQDLFERGKELRFGEGGVVNGDPKDSDIVIWVTPPSPLQREQAVREGQAERARLLLKIKKYPESVPALISEQYVSEMSDATIIEYLVELHDADHQSEATRTVLSRDEWEDIDALRDAMRQWDEAGSPVDDPEWNELLARDTLFGEEVQEEMDRVTESTKESFRLLPRAEIERRALEKRVDAAGNQAFMDAYQNALLFYSCREEEDHRELFFQDVEDMRSFPEEVLEAIMTTFATFITEAGEAKNSPRVEDGSEQSPPPEKQETSESSTPEE